MNLKNNFKTMINSFGIIATGAFAKRVIATVDNSKIDEILKEDVYTHVEELTQTYLETLDFPTLMELDASGYKFARKTARGIF